MSDLGDLGRSIKVASEQAASAIGNEYERKFGRSGKSEHLNQSLSSHLSRGLATNSLRSGIPVSCLFRRPVGIEASRNVSRDKVTAKLTVPFQYTQLSYEFENDESQEPAEIEITNNADLEAEVSLVYDPSLSEWKKE
jgi:hypothetical protein